MWPSSIASTSGEDDDVLDAVPRDNNAESPRTSGCVMRSRCSLERGGRRVQGEEQAGEMMSPDGIGKCWRVEERGEGEGW